MKIITLCMIFLGLSTFSLCENEAGIKFAINQDVVSDLEKKLIPYIVEQVDHVVLPEQSFDLNIKIGNVHCKVYNIVFHAFNILQDQISIKFIEPNKLGIGMNQIKGHGHMNVEYKLWFVKETDDIDIEIKLLNVYTEVTLDWVRSPKDQEKMLPYFKVSLLNIDLDFDFSIHGSVIASFASLFKSKIKSIINEQIQGNIKQSILTQIKEVVDQGIAQFPVYLEFDPSGLAVDYSLLSTPLITNNYLVINSNGAIINVNIPDSKVPLPLPTNLPNLDSNGKKIQVFFSDYSINTALRAAYLTGLLKVHIKSEMVPPSSPLKLNTSSLDMVISGLANLYGKNVPVDVDCVVNDRPIVQITDKSINTDLHLQCSLNVRVQEDVHDEAVKFNTIVSVAGYANVLQQGKVAAQIQSLQMKNSDIVETKIEGANIKNLEILVNLAGKILIPVINSSMLNNITIPLPTIEGITFEESEASLQNGYIEININPNYHITFFQTYLNKDKFIQIMHKAVWESIKKTEKEFKENIEETVQSFLLQ